MKEDKKKSKSFTAENVDKNQEYLKDIEELTQSLVECMREQRTEDLDPFEIYVERIKGKLYANAQEFHDSFRNGYKILLDQLAKQNNDQKRKT